MIGPILWVCVCDSRVGGEYRGQWLLPRSQPRLQHREASTGKLLWNRLLAGIGTRQLPTAVAPFAQGRALESGAP